MLNFNSAKTLLFSISFSHLLLCSSLLILIRKFIHSKPPGRTMVWSSVNFMCRLPFQVTSDIQLLGISVFFVAVMFLPVGAMTRVVYGPLPFTLVFLIIEGWKVIFVFLIGLMNSLGFIQLAIIADFRWLLVRKHPDKRWLVLRFSQKCENIFGIKNIPVILKVLLELRI